MPRVRSASSSTAPGSRSAPTLSSPAFLPKIGGGQILTAETGAKVATYRGLANPTFFVSGTSKDPENATKIIESFTTEEYQKR